MGLLSDALGIKSENQETKGKQMPKNPPNMGLLSILAKARMDTHLTHQKQPDGLLATHNALGEFYETIDPMFDEFVESYYGIFGLEQETIQFSASAYKDPVAYMVDLFKKIDEQRKNYNMGYLLAQIDEFQKLIANTLYKLRYVRSN